MELLSHEVQSLAIKTQYGSIHKPCGHGRGEGGLPNVHITK